MDKSADSGVKARPSFSGGKRWVIRLQVLVAVMAVFAIVVMLNYLGRDYFCRFHLSSLKQNELSPLTVRFLKSLTNHVKVTLYYDRGETSYSEVAALLNEYNVLNHGISVETVDYLRDPGAARRIKEQYKLMLPTQTNLVIFECEGKRFAVDGNALTRYSLTRVSSGKELLLDKRPVAFEGEKKFMEALLTVTNPKKLNAYFLEGHFEHSITNRQQYDGYASLAEVLDQNYIACRGISLLGTNSLADCNLLVIAGPRTAIDPMELEKVERYLNQGGRLLALLNFSSTGVVTGLENLMAKWGIEIGDSVVMDPDNTTDPDKLYDIKVGDLLEKHPIMNPLIGAQLHLVYPRWVGAVKRVRETPETPKAEEIAFSGEGSYAFRKPATKKKFPLMVAVEKGDAKGAIGGATRMVIAGDSVFLDNQMIQSAANRDFAGYAVNWLLDRTQLLEGVGSRKIALRQVSVTASQLTRSGLVLMGAMPGSVLLLGALVWWRRRR
jgi:hypothetical protein